jgi:hypothetical protein
LPIAEKEAKSPFGSACWTRIESIYRSVCPDLDKVSLFLSVAFLSVAQ